MTKGRFVPFVLFFAIFLGFAVVPLIKVSIELFLLQRSASNVARMMESEQVNFKELKTEFASIGDSGLRLKQELEYPLWGVFAGLAGNSDTLKKITSLLPDAASLAESTPDLLGFDRPKKYMLVFQNSAEARGTGGIIGAYAVVTVDRASFSVDRVGSNVDLQHMDRMPIEISSDFYFTYGDDPAIWQNSNMSPHFPYGARIWSALWKNQTGTNLDGVLAVDPLVLKAILGVTGPLRLDDGSSINVENVVSETLSDVYQRFDGRNIQRKSYLVEIAQKTLELLQIGNFSRVDMGMALISPYEENRILFYSASPGPQKALEKTLLGGSLDRGGKDFRLVIQNIAGNKMDYYLDRELEVKVLECGVSGRTRVSATVANRISALKPLPTYVKGRLDLGKPEGSKNSHAISVFLYGPAGSELLSSKITGYPQDASFSGYERKRSFYSAPIELTAGGSVKVEAEFEGGFTDTRVTIQPLVTPQSTQISNPCR